MTPMKFVYLLALLTATVAPLAAQVTETAETIKPGSFFVRMDAVSVGINRDTADANKFTALGLASTIVSAGLTRSVDLQVGFQLFVRETYQYRGARSTHSGLGDLTFRTKWTFWRDESVGAAAAVIPYVKIPSNSDAVGNGSVEGGIIVPWAMTLAGAVKAGAMVQWDILRNDANNGYDSRWYASAYMQRDLLLGFGLYGEATVAASSASASSFAGTMGGGATLNISKSLQFDYGINRGLGGRATDWMHVLRVRWGF